jgi:sulfur-oxidizing protein SoxY
MIDRESLMFAVRALRRSLLLACMAGACVVSASAQESEAWPQIRSTLFLERPVAETETLLKVVAPKTAEDAAVVPVSITISADAVRRARALTFVVDNNPAPVVAKVNFGSMYRTGADVGDRILELRFRLDQLSPVRAILELEDGSLHMASRFVAGSGGCSSTAVKDVDQALVNLGRTRLKLATDRTRGENWREVQAQIRHPNFTGMQINAKTNSYTSAHYIDHIQFNLGDKPLATFETGISISEDPNIRLSFAANVEEPLMMKAQDTEGNEFKASATSNEAMH